MTPQEVRAMSADEYLAFLGVMDDYRRELERQARKQGKGRRG